MSGIELLLTRDCLGGERIVEVRLPRGVEVSDLDRIEGVNSRVVLSHLPRPFFRIDVPGRFLVTGIVTDPRVRFTVRMAVRAQAVELALAAADRMLGA